MTVTSVDGESANVPFAPSPMDAVPDMRATARWITAAAAAVGSLLLGAGPLTAIGKVTTLGDAGWAFLGLIVSLVGVGVAIWFTAEALSPPITTLATLDNPQLNKLRSRIATETGAFFGPFGNSAAELRAAVTTHASAAAQIATLLSREQDPDNRTVLEQALRDAHANEALARQLQRRLLEFIHVWQIREALRRARLITIVAMIVVALGAVIFLLATADPAKDPKPAPSASASTGP